MMPNLEFHLLKEVGHFYMLEKPDELNRLILEYVGKLK
jgi:pimeloyl-ACP methyl ester carboxylesterase